MISQPFVLLRKWILSMIVVGQAAGTPPDKSESDCFEPERHIGDFDIFGLETENCARGR